MKLKNLIIKPILSALLCVCTLLLCIPTAVLASTASPISVSFDTNGGEAIDPIDVTFGEKYGRLPSSALTGFSGGDSNWYLVGSDGVVTDTKIKSLTVVSVGEAHKLFVKRQVLAPSVKIELTVPNGISNDYKYYIPDGSERILTAKISNMNEDKLNYTYVWYKDGTVIEGENEPVLTLPGNVSDSGKYKVSVTATLKSGTCIVVTSDTATAEKELDVKIMRLANTLFYNANGGENAPGSHYTGGNTISVSSEVPSRTGYTFAGWSLAADNNDTLYSGSSSFTFANDGGNGGLTVTLYAQWTPVKQTVTFTADDKEITKLSIDYGSAIGELPKLPEKEGCDMAASYWVANGERLTSDTVITKATIIEAVYIEKIEIPTTGDSDNLLLLIIVAILSGGVVFSFLLYKKTAR